MLGSTTTPPSQPAPYISDSLAAAATTPSPQPARPSPIRTSAAVQQQLLHNQRRPSPLRTSVAVHKVDATPVEMTLASGKVAAYLYKDEVFAENVKTRYVN
eukprot:4889774-Amphidinium_carterae.1